MKSWLIFCYEKLVAETEEKKDDFPVESIFLIFSQLNIGKLCLLARTASKLLPTKNDKITRYISLGGELRRS